jgi:hypothetical protein
MLDIGNSEISERPNILRKPSLNQYLQDTLFVV